MSSYMQGWQFNAKIDQQNYAAIFILLLFVSEKHFVTITAQYLIYNVQIIGTLFFCLTYHSCYQ